MSTRSSIILKLKEEDKGKTLSINKDLIPFDNVDEERLSKFKPTEIDKDTEYIGTYCHFDGYPEGVGKDLVKYFDDYEKAKNLILGGYMSCLPTEEFTYYVLNGEEQKVGQLDKPRSVADICSYLYVFEEGIGWRYFESDYDKYKDDFYYNLAWPREITF